MLQVRILAKSYVNFTRSLKHKPLVAISRLANFIANFSWSRLFLNRDSAQLVVEYVAQSSGAKQREQQLFPW